MLCYEYRVRMYSNFNLSLSTQRSRFVCFARGRQFIQFAVRSIAYRDTIYLHLQLHCNYSNWIVFLSTTLDFFPFVGFKWMNWHMNHLVAGGYEKPKRKQNKKKMIRTTQHRSITYKIFMLKLAAMKCECKCLDSQQKRNLFIPIFATGVS